MSDILLVTSLQATVPWLVRDLQRLPAKVRARRIDQWAAAAVDQVGHRGDILQFRGGKPGETAQVWTALARGLAAAAMAPGGITFMGQHWCADHTICDKAMEALATEAALDAIGPIHGPDPLPTLDGRPVATIQPAGGVL
ncbi:hypothetical protein ACFHW1_05070 [Micromonospora sp. LOL_014]|uniref:hypothetical protein n=1 Tax=Micromonospora sp. LOL_014 TaxID=3345415 RepID=UPI003A866968